MSSFTSLMSQLSGDRLTKLVVGHTPFTFSSAQVDQVAACIRLSRRITELDVSFSHLSLLHIRTLISAAARCRTIARIRLVGGLNENQARTVCHAIPMFALQGPPGVGDGARLTARDHKIACGNSVTLALDVYSFDAKAAAMIGEALVRNAGRIVDVTVRADVNSKLNNEALPKFRRTIRASLARNRHLMEPHEQQPACANDALQEAHHSPRPHPPRLSVHSANELPRHAFHPLTTNAIIAPTQNKMIPLSPKVPTREPVPVTPPLTSPQPSDPDRSPTPTRFALSPPGKVRFAVPPQSSQMPWAEVRRLQASHPKTPAEPLFSDPMYDIPLQPSGGTSMGLRAGLKASAFAFPAPPQCERDDRIVFERQVLTDLCVIKVDVQNIVEEQFRTQSDLSQLTEQATLQWAILRELLDAVSKLASSQQCAQQQQQSAQLQQRQQPLQPQRPSGFVAPAFNRVERLRKPEAPSSRPAALPLRARH